MSTANYYFRSSCRMCDANNLVKVMALTPTPPGNDLLKAEELGNPEPTYPLDLYFCKSCNHLQLGHVVDPRILYQKNYSYVSATSAHFVNHLKTYAADMIERFDLHPGTLVADIGSNDGTCLKFFEEAGMNVLGIDPESEIALKATDVVQGVAHWLNDDGVFVLEVGYLLDVYTNTYFDTIYHEHVDYHTVEPFQKLFARVDMEVVGVQRVSPQGGSIRVMAQKNGGKFDRDDSVDILIQLEHEKNLDQPATFEAFDRKITEVRDNLQKLVRSIKSNGKSIAGFGAPTKATTLLSHFMLGADILDFIVDDNPLKQGLYTPATHIPIYSAQALYEKKPDYVLILAWNFAEPIMGMHRRYQEQGGQFIVPMPIPRIVE